MKIGFVIADNYEYDPFRKVAAEFAPEEFEALTNNCIRFNFDEKIEVVAMECGIGKVNAAIAALWLINEENVDIILNVGLSGAVQNVQKNFIVAGTEYMECDFDLTAIGYDLGVKPQDVYIYKSDEKLISIAEKCSVDYFGKLGTGDIFLADSVLKAKFRDLFGICSFDMETGAIASVCHCCEMPFMSIRKVSDDSEDSAAEDYQKMNALAETALADILLEVLKNL